MANRVPANFKDFYIAVGQPGAYTNATTYTDALGTTHPYYESVLAVADQFGLLIKHAPYSMMANIKNVVVQSWKDEDGDDVWLPRTVGSVSGTYNPAITHEAVEYEPTFIYYGDADSANVEIRRLRETIAGRWLKIWDEYTQIGYEGVYLLDFDDNPTFKRRNYDYVEFTLRFKVNGADINAPFDGIN